MEHTDEVIQAFKTLHRCGIRLAKVESSFDASNAFSGVGQVGPITTTFELIGINIKVDSGKLGAALTPLFTPDSTEDFIV